MTKTRPLGKVIGYGAAAILTAPLWFPVAATAFIVGYGVYQSGKLIVKHPGKLLAGAGLAATLWYGGCIPTQITPEMKQTIAQSVFQSKTETLEEIVEEPTVNVYKEEGFNFYYVKQGDTLSRISENISGDETNYVSIAEDNNIEDPGSLVTGSRLRIREEYCTENTTTVFTQVPTLEQRLLEGTITLTQEFGDNADEVFEINRQLGLEYTDQFSYPAGKRIVWHLP